MPIIARNAARENLQCASFDRANAVVIPMVTEPILEAADFFAPPGYHMRTCAVQSRSQTLTLELERDDGRRVELYVNISGFADEPNCWRWLKDVIDLEALWAL